MAFAGQEFPNADFYKSDLSQILKTVKELTVEIENLDERTKHVEELYESMMVIYNELKAMYDKIIAGDIPQPILDTILRWCRENITKLVAEVMKNVFFGLDDDGHFVAYIPDSWDGCVFNTSGYDLEVEIQPEFGHLILSY